MTKFTSAYQKNFTLLKWMSGLRFYYVLQPFYVIYARHIHLSYNEIFITQAIFALGLIFFTLPCGVFSDLFGRKISLIYGSCLYFLGGLCFIFFQNFFGFSAGEIILALGFAFLSGSESALLYESAQFSHQLENYLNQESKLHAYARFGESLSGITGGLLATISLNLLVIVPIIVTMPLIILSFFLCETHARHHSLQLFKKRLASQINKQKLRIQYFLFNKKKRLIQMIIIYSALLSSITLSSFWLLQVFIDQYQLSYIGIGVIWLIYQLVTSFASNYAINIITFAREKIWIILPGLLLIMLTILTFTSSAWNFIFILMAAITFGIKMPLIFYILNQNISSTARASVLSLDSLITRLIFSALALILGYVLDRSSIHQAFGVLLIPEIGGLVLSWYLFKQIKLKI